MGNNTKTLRIFYLLIGYAVFNSLADFLMQYNSMSGYSVSEANSILRITLNILLMIIKETVLWIAIILFTKERKGGIISLVYSLIILISSTIYFLNFDSSNSYNLYFPRTILYSLNFLVFGYFYFKDKRAVNFLLISLVFTGFYFISSAYPFFQYIRKTTRFLDIDELMRIKVYLENDVYRLIYWPELLFNSFKNLYQFVLFIFLFDLLNKPGKVDLTFKSFHLKTDELDTISFSIKYWSLRICLIICSVGIVNMLIGISRNRNPDLAFYLAPFFYLIFIYALGSCYRNLLVSYLLSRGKRISWRFILLNVPVVNFITWIVTVFTTSFNPSQINQEYIEDQKKNHASSDRISTIKGILGLLLVINIFIQFMGLNFSAGGSEAGLTAAFLILSVVLYVWFMNDHRVYYFLIAIEFLAIIGLYLMKEENLAPVIMRLGFGLANIIIYFGLFHFHHFEINADGNAKDDSLT